ncbi:hypothetical protein B7P43_G12246 [Cryptotermes secundus]|uniref:Envelope fusion protein n=1 Tax=Cryptotermes secundus TaxID=105785 RepID=A0A2J7Q497_9NEOP|nr:hypothetical protein B7P43_G12246 [Cryptotermes secundus]
MELFKWTLAITLCIFWELLNAQTVEEIQSKSGIYFDEVGTVLFYPMKWKVVTYINLEPTRELWKQTKSHQRKASEFCQKIKDKNWYHYTDCAAFDQYMRSKTKYIDNLKDLVAEYLSDNTQNSNHRVKRGVLNFVGEISKILFGTLTQSDARGYNQQITELEKEQKEFLHLSREQMTVIKTTITSVNTTLQKVNQNERVLKEGLSKLSNFSAQKFSELEEEIRNVNLINEQFRLIQRGIDESQHSFEILIDAFVHAEQGTLQPQLITAEKIKQLIGSQKLPSGLDYPNFPFPQLQKIITPITYSYKQYLVYVLEIPLFSPTTYQLYKLLPLPTNVKEEKSTYTYIHYNKEFIFSDPLRQHFGKMTANELTGCFHPSELTYVCREEIPIYTYVPEMDCEATLLHPSTTRIPNNCEYRVLKLSKTFWIPLHMSNQWLFVTPQSETFTVLCPQGTTTFKLEKGGKLTLKPGCKGYSSYVTLYAISMLSINSTNDYVPTAPVNFDCCFENLEDVKFKELPLQVPLVNIMSSIDDLRIASMKVNDVQNLIKEQELKHNQRFYKITTWGTTFGLIGLIFIGICCSCCCCKCCRDCFFWFWSRLSRRDCWKQTHDKCCVSIYNYNGSRVEYSKTNTSPAISMKSLPEIGNAVTESPKRLANETLKIDEELDCISKRTRSKRMFR